MKKKLSLCQYYDQHVIKMGYKSWNHFCAEMKGNYSIEWYKKKLKQEYKKNVKAANAENNNNEIDNDDFGNY